MNKGGYFTSTLLSCRMVSLSCFVNFRFCIDIITNFNL